MLMSGQKPGGADGKTLARALSECGAEHEQWSEHATDVPETEGNRPDRPLHEHGDTMAAIAMWRSGNPRFVVVADTKARGSRSPEPNREPAERGPHTSEGAASGTGPRNR